MPADNRTMNVSHDVENSYCPMLGHYVPFKYCRTVNDQFPCRKIKDCWFERMEIERYIADNYSGAEIERIFSPQPQKISTIIDLINKARENS
jgi:hypothetical protein